MAVSTNDIPDSSDWLHTPVAPLRTVESALRCQVCKDFFNDPVITTCAHTFCSICIRRCLTADGQCPICRQKDQEIRLRKNNVVEELVEAFQAARPSILQLGQNAMRTNFDTTPLHKKRKSDELEDEGDEGSQRVTRSRSQRSPKLRRPHAESKHDEQIVDDSEDGQGDEDLTDDYRPDDGTALCPICNKRMKVEQVDPHLDTHFRPKSLHAAVKPLTLGKSSTASHSIIGTTARPDRLAGLNYSLENERSLRKKLEILGIPSNGTKQLLMRRHTEWVTRWNANVASSKPKSKAQLLNDLTAWERTQGVPAPHVSTASSNAPQVMSKDFDRNAWSSNHGGDFKDLIAQARRQQAKGPMNGDSNGSQAEACMATDQTNGSDIADIEQVGRHIDGTRSEPYATARRPEVIDLDGD